MTASNHVLTGALLLAAVPHPAMLPVALVSHFALDALPHFDAPDPDHTKKEFVYILFSDMAVAGSILLAIIVWQPVNWPLLVAGGILAASPDLMWFPHWVNELRGRPNKELGAISKFHSAIQRYTHFRNWPIEAAWFLVSGLLLLRVA